MFLPPRVVMQRGGAKIAILRDDEPFLKRSKIPFFYAHSAPTGPWTTVDFDGQQAFLENVQNLYFYMPTRLRLDDDTAGWTGGGRQTA